jgi:hypothetical protein
MTNQIPAPPVAPARLPYVNRPDVAEAFADSIARMRYDGATLRVEFAVNRVDEVLPTGQNTGTAVTSCRLVLSAAGMIELFARLNGLMNELRAQGLLRTTPPGEAAPDDPAAADR